MPSMWKRAMVYLGLADDEEYADYGEYDDAVPQNAAPQNAGHAPQQQNYGQPNPAYPSAYGPEPSPVRMIPRDEPVSMTAPEPAPFMSSAVRTIPQPSARLHVVNPASFNEAREIADRYKARAPVIPNLATTDRDSARRLLDF